MEMLQWLPFFGVIAVIILLAAAKQWYSGSFTRAGFMLDVMGFFFIVFGAAKLFNWHSFITMYPQYDLVAQYIPGYAMIYPFIEIALGLAYLFRFQLMIINTITLILMTIGSIGVIHTLIKGTVVTCACLGGLFALPVGYVTLAEDIIMALMALMLLL